MDRADGGPTVGWKGSQGSKEEGKDGGIESGWKKEEREAPRFSMNRGASLRPFRRGRRKMVQQAI